MMDSIDRDAAADVEWLQARGATREAIVSSYTQFTLETTQDSLPAAKQKPLSEAYVIDLLWERLKPIVAGAVKEGHAVVGFDLSRTEYGKSVLLTVDFEDVDYMEVYAGESYMLAFHPARWRQALKRIADEFNAYVTTYDAFEALTREEQDGPPSPGPGLVWRRIG